MDGAALNSIIAITPGEPAGIGPDLCIQLAQHSLLTDFDSAAPPLLVIADPDLLSQRAKLLGLPLKLIEYRPDQSINPIRPGELLILPVPLAEACEAGQLNTANAAYVLETLAQASDGCLRGEFQAMVTGPVQKSIINEAGISFSGHTEYLAERCASKQVVMMLATKELRVALATTHLPLSEVPATITQELLLSVINILHADLKNKFGIAEPVILVAGLNPHAGENGHLGREEIEVITPVIEQLQSQGMNLQGPLPADTLFTAKYLQNADAVLAMYHDQGLPVLKFQGFGKAVNITLGLPIIRTSVDHGTALDLAGSGKADSGSLLTAIEYASTLVKKAVIRLDNERTNRD